MKKTGIFYGSTTGTTEAVAKKIAENLGIDSKDIYNVATAGPADVADYDVLIIGASTWGAGDLQADMATFIDGLQSVYLGDKMVAIFGCGSGQMKKTFCNSVGEIYHRLHDTHAQFFAPFNNDGYTYEHSDADVKGMIVGLCIDDATHPELTDIRVKEWCADIKQELMG